MLLPRLKKGERKNNVKETKRERETHLIRHYLLIFIILYIYICIFKNYWTKDKICIQNLYNANILNIDALMLNKIEIHLNEINIYSQTCKYIAMK